MVTYNCLAVDINDLIIVQNNHSQALLLNIYDEFTSPVIVITEIKTNTIKYTPNDSDSNNNNGGTTEQ